VHAGTRELPNNVWSLLPSSRYPLHTRTCLCQSAFKGLELLEEEKERLCRNPRHQQESTGRHSEHQERAEMMIVSLSAQGAVFFHAHQPTQPRRRQSNHRGSPSYDRLMAPVAKFRARALPPSPRTFQKVRRGREKGANRSRRTRIPPEMFGSVHVVEKSFWLNCQPWVLLPAARL
jgi:hypothetical protein